MDRPVHAVAQQHHQMEQDSIHLLNMDNQLTTEQRLQLKLDFTYNFCKKQGFKHYETILYMQSHCETDTATVVNYLNEKENDTERI